MNRIKLFRFRIQNYQCVTDSGWVDIEDLTTFVGKNESGKTALLTALYKLNPATPVKYDGLYDFPRNRYTDEFKTKDWIVATGEFHVPKDVFKDLKLPESFTIPEKGITLALSRRYSGAKEYTFIPSPEEEDYSLMSRNEIKGIRKIISRKAIRIIVSDPEEDVETNKSFTKDKKDALLKLIDDYNLDLSTLRKFCDDIGGFVESCPEITGKLDELEEIIKKKDQPTHSERLWNHVEEEIPVFIYFENYGVLDGRIHIPTFVQQLEAKSRDSRVRTQQTMFKHVGLDPSEVYKKGQKAVDYNKLRNISPSEAKTLLESFSEKDQRSISERQILLNSASQKMSEKFSGWWGQRTHKFDYTVDSDYFEILVSDDIKSVLIPFNGRSKGLKWFFSFYLIFLVESSEMHKNAILLLDEPGLSLHPTAKLNLIKFLDEIKEKNQVLYSTHSPFLIDGDHLERIRGVVEGDDGKTKVVTSLGIIDKHTAFPLQALLGYSIMQTLFLGKKHLLVEGLSDYNYIKAMSLILQRFTDISLQKDIIIVPSGGASKVTYLASLFISQGSKPVVILDADQAGMSRKKNLQMTLFATQQDNLLLVDKYITGKKYAEIEDIIGASLLLNSLKKIIDPVPLLENLGNDSFCNEIENWYKHKGIELPQEWKILLAIRFYNDAALLTLDKIEDEVLNRFKKLVSEINDLF